MVRFWICFEDGMHRLAERLHVGVRGWEGDKGRHQGCSGWDTWVDGGPILRWGIDGSGNTSSRK